jgi:hypothetical protein
MLAAALLQADLRHSIIGLDGLDDVVPLFDGEGQRLFDVDVLARVERVDRHPRMPVVGRGDQDGVDVFRSEQRVVIGEGLCLAPGLFERGVEVLVIAIAERDDLDVGFFLKDAHHVAAAIARADDAETDSVIGAHHAVPACGGAHQARRAGAGLGDEFTTRTVCFRHKVSFLAGSVELIDASAAHCHCSSGNVGGASFLWSH